MKKTSLIILLVAIAVTGYTQSAKEIAETLAGTFKKEKHKTKTKNGVTTETHTVRTTIPDIQDDAMYYAGRYLIEGLDQYIVLRQSANHTWEGDYLRMRDGKEIKLASLTDIKIESGLLTTLLQDTEGKTTPLQAVFMVVTENGSKSTGLGICQKLSLPSGINFEKAFYRKTDQ